MSKKLLLLLTLVALAGVAAAGALTIQQRDETLSLHAERFTVGDLFTIKSSRVSPVLGHMSQTGGLDDAVEMGIGYPAVRTALVQDHWMYVARVEETSAGAVEIGQFEITLEVDGDTVANLYAIQSVPNPTGIEGVTAYFDLGTTIQDSSLYYVVVRPYLPVGEIVEYTVLTDKDGTTFQWEGDGGEIEGVVNPQLNVTLGETLRLTGRNADGGFHNLGIRDADPPNFKELGSGAEVLISWRPTTAGTYVYECQFHPGMEGDIVVSSA